MRTRCLLLLSLALGLGCPARPPRPIVDAGATPAEAGSGLRDAGSPSGADSCGDDEDAPPPAHCELAPALVATQNPSVLLAALLARASERNEAGQALRRTSSVLPHIAGRGTAQGSPLPPASPPIAAATAAADLGSPDRSAGSDRSDRSDLALPLFREALSCASTALRVRPDSLPGLRQRAIAQRELSQADEARDTLSRALALFPDDAETLALAADLYISHLSATREHSELGLLYAEQGRKRLLPKPLVASNGKTPPRRRKPPGPDALKPPPLSDATRGLLARLWLLSGQALLDLGRASEALPALDESLRLRELPEARYERAVALFELVRPREALTAFQALLAASPPPPSRQAAFVHYHLGLILEFIGQSDEAERELAAARTILPEQFPEPLAVTPAAFKALVDTETRKLSPEQAADLKRVQLELADLPDPRDLTLETPPLSPTILGLYRGLPLGDEPSEPRSIVLYRKNLLRAVRSPAELIREIKKTLLHELGHLHGADEDDLRQEGLE